MNLFLAKDERVELVLQLLVGKVDEQLLEAARSVLPSAHGQAAKSEIWRPHLLS